MADKPTLDLISEALAGVEERGRVYYGTASKLPKGAPWNYTVFSRAPAKPSGNLTSISDGYEVAVVREGYVPEGLDKRVIDAMGGIPGMRLEADSTIEYAYQVKPGTRDTVEMMVVRFRKARKP